MPERWEAIEVVKLIAKAARRKAFAIRAMEKPPKLGEGWLDHFASDLESELWVDYLHPSDLAGLPDDPAVPSSEPTTEDSTDRAMLLDRLNREASHCASANSYGADVLAPLMRNAVEAIEATDAMVEQFCRDLNAAHDEILRVQGVAPEKWGDFDWPVWSGPANSIRWAEARLGKPLSKRRIAATALSSSSVPSSALRALARNTPCAICGHRFDRHITEPDIEINYLTCADCETCPGFRITERCESDEMAALRGVGDELLAALKNLNEEARREGHDDCDDWNWQEYIRAADVAIANAEAALLPSSVTSRTKEKDQKS